MDDHPDDLLRHEPVPPHTLYRPRDNRLIAGVCAGIARYYGWSATRVRIVYVIASIVSAAFPGILAYFVLWLLMPGDPKGPRTFRLH